MRPDGARWLAANGAIVLLPANAGGKLNITKCGIVMCQGCSNACKPRR